MAALFPDRFGVDSVSVLSITARSASPFRKSDYRERLLTSILGRMAYEKGREVSWEEMMRA